MTRWVCGTRHQQQQLPCQDYGAEVVRGPVVMGAIADGAGTASYAEVGARLAVNTMLEVLNASNVWLHDHQSSWQTMPLSALEEATSKCFVKGIETVQNALYTQAQKEGYAINELACTLLGFLATPHWVAAFQVGDGFIVVRSPDSRQRSTPETQQGLNSGYQLLFQPDKGEYANQTTFVTSSTALSALQTRVVVSPQQFICASTDGLETVAIRRRDATPFAPFFQPLEEYLVETLDPDQNDEYVMTFLRSDRLNRRTDDDKTLLLCRYSASR